MAKGPHYRVTVKGGYGQSASELEQWQWSVNVDADAVPVDDGGADALADAALAQYNAVNGMRTKLPAYAFTREIDVRFINALGLQERASDGSFIGTAVRSTVGPGTGSSTPVYPPHVALVCSLLTNRSGPSGKGRVFLPAPALAIDSGDFLLAEAAGDAIRDSLVGYINALNNVNNTFPAHGLGNVSVMSTKGFASTVTGVRVGRVLDTQRSRRRDLLERYGAPAAVTA